MRNSSRIYLVASFVAQASGLVRYVLLSRLLGPQELGLAAVLLLTSQFFEQVTDTASDRFILQDPDGDEPLMAKVMHLLLSIRGAFLAVTMALTASLLAHLYKMPELTWPLLGMAITPLIAGFVNVDMYRVQRAGKFGAASIDILSGEAAGLVGTLMAAFLTHSHVAVVYGLAARGVALLVVSQTTATRPYGWAFAKVEARRFMAFAVPLFLNGLLLFLGSQGDRVLVGRIGVAELGRYSAILLLIASPVAALSRYLVNIHLPKMAADRVDPAAFIRTIDAFGGRVCLLCVGMAVGFVVVAPLFAPLLYGPAFHQDLIVFALMAALQTARLLRIGPTTVALSNGRTTIAMLDNATRLVALPIALGLQLVHPGLASILIGFIVGEVLAVVVTLLLTVFYMGVPVRSGLTRVAVFCLSMAAIVGVARAVEQRNGVAGAEMLALGLLALVALIARERRTLGEVKTLLVALTRRGGAAAGA